jgi:hypothetical protein
VFPDLVSFQGLKTGMYYLRTRAAADAIKFTVDTGLLKENGNGVGVQILIPYIILFLCKMIHQPLAYAGE